MTYKYATEDDLPDIDLVSNVRDWLLGRYMDKKMSKMDIAAVVEGGKWFQKNYPVKSKTLYRFLYIQGSPPNTALNALKVKNPVSSWTDSIDKAQYFYEKIQSFSEYDVKKKSVGYIVSTKMPSRNILFSLDSIKAFADDCDPKMLRKAYHHEYKDLAEMPKDHFFKAQAEHVCYFPNATQISVNLECYFYPRSVSDLRGEIEWVYVP